MEENIIHTRGNNLDQNMTISAGGSPVDLTGSQIEFSIKNKFSDSSYVLHKVATITDAENGKCSVSFSAEEMKLEIKDFYYDIQLTDSLGSITTIKKGKLTITYKVTN